MGFKKYCQNLKDNNQNVDETKKIENLYNEYKDKNEDELLSKLLENVQKQKADGTFDFNSINAAVEKMSPFLTKEQNIKIKNLLEKIK